MPHPERADEYGNSPEERYSTEVFAAPLVPATLRVIGWGVFAMATTAAVGCLFGVSV